ncbi:MAG: hypothetical protein CVU71_04885 [Deltaproteobacteria bacterium HGW-Deltaproteobacteria-6]|jgi:hypothetical protein|nr:MAG: hypothetical protein CVU71_04885 [Deltaproteobacteria bacterium HGW-Deltaproteobacteria-6]
MVILEKQNVVTGEGEKFMGIIKMNKKSLMMVMVLIVFFLMDITPGATEQYYCQAASDICNYNRTVLTINVGCMNSQSWVCTRAIGSTIECVAGSLKKTPSQTDWFSPQKMCDSLCNVCTSGWSLKQSGGSMY